MLVEIAINAFPWRILRSSGETCGDDFKNDKKFPELTLRRNGTSLSPSILFTSLNCSVIFASVKEDIKKDKKIKTNLNSILKGIFNNSECILAHICKFSKDNVSIFKPEFFFIIKHRLSLGLLNLSQSVLVHSNTE